MCMRIPHNQPFSLHIFILRNDRQLCALRTSIVRNTYAYSHTCTVLYLYKTRMTHDRMTMYDSMMYVYV